MALVFWLLVALVPCLIGMGALRILYGNQTTQEMRPADYVLTGVMICIGLAEAAHWGAVMLGWSFSCCVNVFLVEVAALSLVAAIIVMFGIWLPKRKKCGTDDANAHAAVSKREKKWGKRFQAECLKKSNIPMFLFVLLTLVQIVYVMTRQGVYIDGDMTLETVNTFLFTDTVYQVNPMTGRPYTLGMPFRLKILCLPTLYGALSAALGLEAEALVYGLIPTLVLVGSYLAYSTVAGYLFPDDAFKRWLLMALVALLMGSGGYLYGMDGFSVLNSGFRGVAIRGAILLPYTVGLVLRKKYILVLLCILTEACIVWTFYGMGACLLVAACLVMVECLCAQYVKRKGRGEDVHDGTPE